ncbi:ATP-binding protein [Paenibacillus polymyxa]|uniref:ATP-binding protein n=1 Tax=Paenibacillus polymyxa TaxID=1406 RepID=UPI002024B4A8|nr:ATP-binding protein [Paenibacillus polymyxa]URJ43760.3 ATP-binding protein [Paenibacillus polymyxa]
MVKTSRLKVGIITVSPRQESVQELLHVAQEQMIPKADTKDISIVMENTPIHTCFVLKWMAEAVYNIMDNAVNYTETGGSITIKVIPYDLFCRIDITNRRMSGSDCFGLEKLSLLKVATSR